MTGRKLTKKGKRVLALGVGLVILYSASTYGISNYFSNRINSNLIEENIELKKNAEELEVVNDSLESTIESISENNLTLEKQIQDLENNNNNLVTKNLEYKNTIHNYIIDIDTKNLIINYLESESEILKEISQTSMNYFGYLKSAAILHETEMFNVLKTIDELLLEQNIDIKASNAFSSLVTPIDELYKQKIQQIKDRQDEPINNYFDYEKFYTPYSNNIMKN